MIVANSTWGGLLASKGVAAIYRVQTGGKVRMSTSPQAHEGLGVKQYAWSSSPLRRYVDLLNQWQLVACLNGDTPPFAARSDALFAALRDFELTYAAYAEFQRSMERYWCLRWLRQQGIETIAATIIGRENLARFDHLPLLQRVPSAPELKPGQRIRLHIESIDYLTLALGCRYVETLPLAAVAGVPTTRRWRRSIEVNAASRDRLSIAGWPAPAVAGARRFPAPARPAAVAAFQFPDASRTFQERALDVILVNSRSARAPAEAQVLAQANLDGGGNTEQDRRAKTPLPPHPGIRTATTSNTRKAHPGTRSAPAAAGRKSASRTQVAPTPDKEAQPEPAPSVSGRDLAHSALAMARLEGEIAKELDDYNKRPRKKFIGTSAMEYRFAQYSRSGGEGRARRHPQLPGSGEGQALRQPGPDGEHQERR
jgi:hypothetical protein